MKFYFTVVCIFILYLFSIISTSFAQQNVQNKDQNTAIIKSTNHDSNFVKKSKKSFYARKTDWQAIIDSTWGMGLPTTKKLQIFDLYWNAVDDDYAGFVNLNVNWDSLRALYLNQIDSTTSRGRFAAIMNQLVLALMEIHTHCIDYGVRGDSLHSGVPLMAFHSVYQPYNQGHFGAGLTPLPDSSSLVFKVVDNHPLGLVPGDVILGYNGIPWKYMYRELLAAELPFTGPSFTSPGSSIKSNLHIWLMSAGLNWHLCDTVDILKYSTGDTLHLSTSILENQNMELFCAEQLPVPGVPMLNLSGLGINPMVSWGVVDNTQIGYIYVSQWYQKDKNPFTNAVNNLLENTTGLILDFRGNSGGDSQMAYGGYRRLFNFVPTGTRNAKRADPNDHFAMVPVFHGYPEVNPDIYLYDRPIAVLTGPVTFSAAEYIALRFKSHPMVRIFGKSTNTGFTNYNYQSLHNVIQNNPNFPNWEAGYAPENAYLVTDPSNYLMHTGFDVDEEVWFTREDVANGEDTVVKAAMAWINSMIHAYNVKPNSLFVKPGIDTLTITANIKNPNDHNLNVAALINTLDSVHVDSISMYDDGNHSDSLAADGLYGCYLNPVTSEDVFTISASVTDLDSTHYHLLANVKRFTSIGPVVVRNTIVFSDSVRPGERIPVKLILQNMGTTATAMDVTAEIFSIDTSLASVYLTNNPVYGNILPGDSSETTGGYHIDLNKNCPGFSNVFFEVKIASSDYVFWTDTFSVYVNAPSRIVQTNNAIPKEFALRQNYPNPFNPSTNIEFTLPYSEFATLKIYNLLGQEVTTLVSEKLTSGIYTYTWDASDLTSGVYFYILRTHNGYVKPMKLILLK